MLTHKGTKKIETKGLILRRVMESDAQQMYDNWASDEAVTRYLTWPAHESLEVTKMVIGNWIKGYERDDFYQWIIVLKAGNVPVGTISVVALSDSSEKAEIGYCIGRQWWHQGITSEALQAVMDFLFDEVGMNRIEAKHDPRNPHSGGVMKKCGMTLESISRKSFRSNQGICDMVCYALLKEERSRKTDAVSVFSPERDEELVQEVYRRFDEDSRLRSSKAARVEFLTTVRIIEEYLKPGDKILDLGAGTGAYSLYFAQKGYSVSALELADSNLAVFRSKLTGREPIDLRQGNAMDLSGYGDASFDIVLLFGPLYHLHEEKDRLRCIQEARRVCKPGGKLFFAFISNDIVILTMQQEVPDYLLTGDYDKETFRLYDVLFVFHTVDRCRELLKKGGIRILREAASDGLSELLQKQINNLDEASYQQYLRYHAYLCEKPECLGMSNHLLFAGEAE